MLLFIVSVASFASFVSSESCFVQRCLGCHPQETVWTGTPRECAPANWVSAEWLHKLGHPPPHTESKFNMEMRCLKMVATPDDKSYGNTVDVVRGCVPRAQVDSVCLGLVAVERARGHSDARCFICNRNECNDATRSVLTLFTSLTIITLYFVLR